MQDEPLKGREVIFEFTPMGNVVRVSAMDSETLTEIAIQCPRATPETLMKRNALMRLEYVLRKKDLL